MHDLQTVGVGSNPVEGIDVGLTGQRIYISC